MGFDIEEYKPPVRQDVGLLSMVSSGDEVDSESDEAKVDGQGFSAEKSVELGADGAGGSQGEAGQDGFEEVVGAKSGEGETASLSEYERRRAEVKELAGMPYREYLDWDRDIWEQDLPERETMALVNLRKQTLGIPVPDAAVKTGSAALEKAAVRIGRGEISTAGDLTMEVSHTDMTLEDRKAIFEILQMKGPKEKAVAPTAMRLFSYLPRAESADLKCYKETLAEVWEDFQEEQAEEGSKKRKMTMTELCRTALQEVWREKQVREREHRWLGEK